MNDGFRYKNFLLAYNDFKRNGTIPNNPDILEDVKDLYMDNLSSDYTFSNVKDNYINS